MRLLYIVMKVATIVYLHVPCNKLLNKKKKKEACDYMSHDMRS